MKKLLVILLTIIMVVAVGLLGGCSIEKETKDSKYCTMIIVEDLGSYRILVDKETCVMYLENYASHQGGITVLLNADGTPKLYDGLLK